MPRVTMNTDAGIVGLPEGVKESRIDFAPDEFLVAIATKGYRLAWSRAMLCPCKPINDQTKQADPNCTLCDGRGWLYFTPSKATSDRLVVGELDDVQQRLVDDNSAVIEGLLSGIMSTDHPYGEIGKRLSGTMSCTVHPDNKLGYWDKLVHLDSVIAYSQVMDPVTDLTEVTETRYPIHQVNVLRTANKTFTAPTDFDLVEGKIVWNTGSVNLPASDTPLAIHYLCHPTWLVTEHPHALRMTPTVRKLNKRPAPAGEYIDLPIQATVSYEFLPRVP
jgi:hypothetical protein